MTKHGPEQCGCGPWDGSAAVVVRGIVEKITGRMPGRASCAHLLEHLRKVIAHASVLPAAGTAGCHIQGRAHGSGGLGPSPSFSGGRLTGLMRL